MECGLIKCGTRQPEIEYKMQNKNDVELQMKSYEFYALLWAKLYGAKKKGNNKRKKKKQQQQKA